MTLGSLRPYRPPSLASASSANRSSPAGEAAHFLAAEDDAAAGAEASPDDRPRGVWGGLALQRGVELVRARPADGGVDRLDVAADRGLQPVEAVDGDAPHRLAGVCGDEDCAYRWMVLPLWVVGGGSRT